jgi:hypothetical protein
MAKKRGRLAGSGVKEVISVRFTHCRDLQKQVIELAIANGISVNQLIVDILKAHFVASQKKGCTDEA